MCCQKNQKEIYFRPEHDRNRTQDSTHHSHPSAHYTMRASVDTLHCQHRLLNLQRKRERSRGGQGGGHGGRWWGGGGEKGERTCTSCSTRTTRASRTTCHARGTRGSVDGGLGVGGARWAMDGGWLCSGKRADARVDVCGAGGRRGTRGSGVTPSIRGGCPPVTRGRGLRGRHCTRGGTAPWAVSVDRRRGERGEQRCRSTLSQIDRANVCV